MARSNSQRTQPTLIIATAKGREGKADLHPHLLLSIAVIKIWLSAEVFAFIRRLTLVH
jgi:hypothetical protein